MPRRSHPAVDPVFDEIAKAIYGDDVDAREVLAKFGSPEAHIDGPVTPQQAQEQKRVAQIGLGATGVAGVAGVHAIKATLGENAARTAAATASAGRHAADGAEGVTGAAKAITRVIPKIKAGTAAKIVGGGALALHGVELVGDSLAAHAQVKALKQANANASQANPNNPVSKALRLKSLNVAGLKVPSLRAKRPSRVPVPGSPGTQRALFQPVAKAKGKTVHQMTRSARAVLSPGGIAQPKVTAASAAARAKAIRLAQIERDTTMSKGIPHPIRNVRNTYKGVRATLGNVEEASRSANTAAASAQQVTEKAKRLIPSRQTAVLSGVGAVGALAGATYLGAKDGKKQAAKINAKAAAAAARTRQAKLRPVIVAQPVAKSVPVDQAWQITKVDADKRQVFGWASVSRIGGQDVVDLQGDLVPIEEIEKSAYRYVIESRKGGDMHKRIAKADDQPLHTADMIESFVVTAEKLEKMGLPPDALPHGWWVGYKVNDDAQWAMVKSGERAGFSIHGSGKRTAVSKADGPTLADRARQAIHPPKVKLHPVKSSAVSAMGYQPQTGRLSYRMRSSPDKTYDYKVGGSKAVDALMADSKGHEYATRIRGKAKRAAGYSPAARLRLFTDPQRKN